MTQWLVIAALKSSGESRARSGNQRGPASGPQAGA